MSALLQVRGLKRHYTVHQGWLGRGGTIVRAVDGVSFQVNQGETLALVGESGCGKSTTARAILRLEEPDDGQIVFDGTDLKSLSAGALRKTRRRMQMVFQDPMASLNPRRTVGDIVAAPMKLHGFIDVPHKTHEALRRVGLSAAHASRYPHELSGGQAQRVGIARVVALQPDLVVCDEALSALDVSIQAQVLNLLADLRDELGLSYLFISHDLSVVRHIADRVAVMYLGRIVEQAPCAQLFEDPKHPYTKALLSAVPRVDPSRRRDRLVLTGEVPSPLDPPTGCAFHPRCPVAQERCAKDLPLERSLGNGRDVRCFLA